MIGTRFSHFCLVSLTCFTGMAHGQGPWPTMSRPSFYSPLQEFSPSRAGETYLTPPAQGHYSVRGRTSPYTSIVPGVPQCANGRCQTNCPQGQCAPSNQCSNGQCASPVQSNYGPVFGANHSGCANGTCRSRQVSPANQGGAYAPRGDLFGLPILQPARSSTPFGFRPLTPSQPKPAPQSRGGRVNRLIPLDDEARLSPNDFIPQQPFARDRESMVPPGPMNFSAPSIRLQ